MLGQRLKIFKFIYLLLVFQNLNIYNKLISFKKDDTKTNIITINNIKQFKELISNKSKAIVAKFYANWCGPCKNMKPNFRFISEKFYKDFEFIEIDIDKNEYLAKQYNIKSIPTLVIFKDGKIQGKLKGYNNINSLENFIKKFITKN